MKTAPVNITIPEKLKKRLQEIAASEHRSLSNLITKVLLDWLKEKENPKDKSSFITQ
ncbi:MAG: ribbon-helix-helix protein, CopG family [Deltaproteobacteria bacterium]|nr:ribbon-helix-helix protein, CopG family [Deltaproteobacteria bacterium]